MKERYKMIDPEIMAKKRRRLMMKPQTREYYIADLESTEMVKDTEITERYFRIRPYMKLREPYPDYSQKWLEASSSEVWSSKFIGLGEDGFQKLEFQNPPCVAAFRLGGDPRDYNNTFVIQINGCVYECSFCFVPRELNTPELKKGKFFKVKDMIDTFMKEREKCLEKGEKLNVIRFSGGEITSIIPELILDIYDEIENRGLSDKIYLWADCNLSILTYLRKNQNSLKEIAKKRNFGIVGCLKTAGDGQSGQDDFAKITKVQQMYFLKQFEVLNFLVNTLKADTYVYLVPIIFGKRETYKKRLYECAQRLKMIHKNLPLRTNVLQIREYKVAYTNMRIAYEEGRPLPDYDPGNVEKWFHETFVPKQKLIFKIWYGEILPSLYESSELNKYRCQIPLTN